jgi:hypothetical protein
MGQQATKGQTLLTALPIGAKLAARMHDPSQQPAPLRYTSRCPMELLYLANRIASGR